MLRFGKTGVQVPPEYTRYIVCREMGWDYFTYMKQPATFVNEIMVCMEAEAENRELNNAKTK